MLIKEFLLQDIASLTLLLCHLRHIMHVARLLLFLFCLFCLVFVYIVLYYCMLPLEVNKVVQKCVS